MMEESFWQQNLRKLPATTPLAIAKPLPTSGEAAARACCEIETTPELVAALYEFTRQNNLDVPTLILGAWALLLGRYSGEAEVAFGVAVAPDGFALMRVPIPPEQTVLPWLRTLYADLDAAHRHPATPAQLRARREIPPEQPWCETLCACEIPPPADIPLTLHVDGDLRLRCEYVAARFEAAAIARLLKHGQMLLGGLIASPQAQLQTIPMLTEAERQQLLVAWNATATATGYQGQCIHRRFERQAEATPDAIAVVYPEPGRPRQTLTYCELNRRANRLARYLRTLGVEPETPVGMCLTRSTAMLVGMLGILKAGGAYVPIDPAYPPERQAFMLADTQTPVLLTERALLDTLPVTQARVVCMDADWPTVAADADTNLDGGAQGDNLAYIIYTSGSTGRPKGVAIVHQSVINLVEATRPIFGFKTQDVWTVFHSYAFDFSVWEIWTPLLCGSRLVIVPQTVTQSPAAFLELLCREEVTVVNQTPSALHRLVDLYDAVTPLSLRLIICGGEALPRALAQRVLTWNVPLWNFYGPTESTVWAACYPVTTPGDTPNVPIGRPLGNIRLYILDRAMQPVPVGVPGELYIGGVGLARGYYHRPELTAEKFSADPFVDEPGARLYKTGDMARYLEDGAIEFLQRLDHQVKVRGFRVELGEIENALARHPAVREAVVMTHPGPDASPRLVAYWTPAPLTDDSTNDYPTIRDFQDFLKQRLPDYMIPAAFIRLETLPLTPNGKIDRQRLPAPDATRPALATAYVAPRTEAEMRLAQIWEQTLHVAPVGIHDNFFELGGDSILSLQIIAAAREAGLHFTVQHIFEYQTVAALAAALSPSPAHPLTPSPTPPLSDIALTPEEGELDNIEARYPLSPMQQGMLFHTLYAPESGMYFEQLGFTLNGELDDAAFERAWQRLVAQHPALRTVFVWEQRDTPLQVVRRHAPLPWTVYDWRALSPAVQQRRLAEWLKADQARSFDLHQAPLMRVTLFRLAETTWRCVWSFHHLLLDGWSLTLALKDVFAFYEAERRGAAVSITPPRPYRDYIAWLGAQDMAEAEHFWRESLRGFTAPTPLYVGRITDIEPAADDYTEQRLRLSADTTTALHTFARQQHVTLNTVLQGAWAVLLSRYSGETDVLFGATVAGRPAALEGVEAMIGLFINTLPVRVSVSDASVLGPWLQTLQTQQAAARRYEYAPLVEIQRWSEVPQGRSLFDTLLVFENYPGEADVQPADPRLTLGDMVTLEKTNYPLTVIVEPGDTLGLRFSYRRQVFDDATIARMLGHLRTLLEGMLAAPQGQVGELPMLTEAERAQLLIAWNATRTDYPRNTPVHRLFEAQAAQTPDAVALRFAGTTLTYSELNRRANRLAHYLRALGVGPEIGVGIYVERSLEMIVGLLAILKAGGAYVPLDPAYPQERLTFILRDTQAPVILTQTQLAGRLPAYQGHIVNLDDEVWATILMAHRGTPVPRRHIVNLADEIWATDPEDNLDGGATADSLAYVMYTSGSTGVPKGTDIVHRAIVRLVKNTNYANLTHEETFLQLATLSFDASTLEIWGSLLNGAELVIFPPHKPSLEELAQFIKAQPITILWLTAGLFHQMVEAHPESLSGVRQLLAGGDVLSVAHVRQMLALLPPGHALINGYGPTENTTFTCCYRMDGHTRIGDSVPIGRPIANTQVYILDRALRPVPIGVPGELYIGGDGLARGYRRQPELTAERFVPHPFDDTPGARLYKSGDRARYLPNGDIEFLGRLDNQVKIRGFRVEPGEIEARLEEHPAVQNAIVVAREDAPGDKRLVAYIVARPGQQPTAETLRAALQTTLPDYMLPAAFVPLDAFPLTPNGKVDRSALPAPDWTPAATAYTAPRTVVEEALVAIWQEVLGVARIGVHDNFFALGGHSLLATRVISRIQQTFQVAVPLRALFEAPTVTGLAAVIEEMLLREIEAADDVRMSTDYTGRAPKSLSADLAD